MAKKEEWIELREIPKPMRELVGSYTNDDAVTEIVVNNPEDLENRKLLLELLREKTLKLHVSENGFICGFEYPKIERIINLSCCIAITLSSIVVKSL